MLTIKQGNFNIESEKNGQWIMGHFIEPGSPFHNTDFEIKFAKHAKGERKVQTRSKKNVKTLGILIYGKFSVALTKEKRTINLAKEGDYIFYNSMVPHVGTALADTLLLVIRWPSIP
jgi:hypothetical protein